MPILSIVVPVYNAEPYLQKCLESIRNQIFQNFEVLMIDDGSTDGSSIICDDYATLDERFIVIHQNNQGVSAARNKGLEIAQGYYVGFVDSDDWIEPDMYEKMIIAAMNDMNDIVICGVRYVGDSNRSGREDLIYDRFLSRNDLFEELFNRPNKIGGGDCNKIFRNKHIFFDTTLSIGEDVLFLFDNIVLANKGRQIDQCLYNVRERADSATRKNETNAVALSLEAYEKIISKSVKLPIVIRNKANEKYIDTWLRYLYLSDKNEINNGNMSKKKLISKLVQMFFNQQITLRQFVIYILNLRITAKNTNCYRKTRR